MDICSLLRPELITTKPFDSTRVGFEQATLLDANESPWNDQNFNQVNLTRYIDGMFDPELLATLSEYYQVAPNQILLTRGSCEGIDLLVRAFCRAYQDSILVCPPTFSIFAQCAALHGASVITVPLLQEQNFKLDTQALLNSVTAHTKLVFICTPNNPTGNLIPIEDIRLITRTLEGKAVVVVDEAYMDFSESQSAASLIDEFSNVVVLRTLSKAFGLAGLRCGVLLAQSSLIPILAGMMLPFPFSVITINALKHALTKSKIEAMKQQIIEMRLLKTRFMAALKNSPGVKHVWDSEGNFVFARFHHIERVLQNCQDSQILVRHFVGLKPYQDYLRITVGLAHENQAFLAALEAACSVISA